MRLFLGLLLLVGLSGVGAQLHALSPTAVVATSDGSTLYVACTTAHRILRFNLVSRTVSASILLPETPLGLAFANNEKQLVVTCAGPESQVNIIDLATQGIVGTFPAGHTAMAPVLSPNGKTLYVCNRFNNEVSVIDLAAKKEIRRVAVQREPVAAAITPDGKYLLVANHLHTGRADVNYVAAAVSVIDTVSNQVIKNLQLPTGSGSLNDLRISPDGKYAVVTHIVGRFSRLSTHVSDGWINANALTVIDLAGMKVHGTMLLDDNHRGAANPWGVAWSKDSATLVVTHAGNHEVSVIDFPKMIAHLTALPANFDPVKTADLNASKKANYELPDDLAYFAGSRVRVKLGEGDLGPRSVVVVGNTAYVANYFSDTLTAITLNFAMPRVESFPLGPKPNMDNVRKGERYFNDAGICYERWQSCASCHPGGGRTDGLNWDLLNDGVNNPKNTKNLLVTTRTAPVMSLGVRANAETAVRAGIQHILFTSQPNEEIVQSMMAYLQSIKPVPSPFLVHGQLSESAKRGKILFQQAKCAECHTPGLFTDQKPHDVGTRGPQDGPTDTFYTPTLLEVWRTAPYLHNGSAATIQDVLKSGNGRHGDISDLTRQELTEICEYVLSL